MPTIGAIVIDLQARTAQLLEGVKQCAEALTKFGDHAKHTQGAVTSMSRTMDLFKKVGEGALGAFGADKLGEFISSQIEVIDQSYQMAKALQAPTDVIMGLASAAFVKAKIESEDFNLRLEQMAKNIEQAASQGGELAKELASFGLDARQLSSMRVDQQFLAVADAINNAVPPARKAQEAIALFGREGAKLLPMFEGGSAALQREVAHARDLGVAIDDIHASQISNVAEQVRGLDEAAEGAERQLFELFAPTLLQPFLHDLNTAIEELNRLSLFMPDEPNLKTSKNLQDAISEANDEINKAAADRRSLPMDASLQKQIDAEQAYVDAIKRRAAAEQQMATFTANTIGVKAAQQFMEAVRQTNKELAEEIPTLKKLQDAQNAQATAQASAKAKADALDRALNQILQHELTPGEKLADTINVLDEALTKGKISWTQYADAIQRAQEEAAKPALDQAAEDQRKAQEQHDDLMKEGEKLKESVETPKEKYDRELAYYRDMLKQKAIDLETFERLSAKAKKDLDKESGNDDLDRRAKAENWNSRLRIQDTNRGDESKKHTAQLERHTYYLGEIYRFQRDEHDATASTVIDF